MTAPQRGYEDCRRARVVEAAIGLNFGHETQGGEGPVLGGVAVGRRGKGRKRVLRWTYHTCSGDRGEAVTSERSKSEAGKEDKSGLNVHK